MQHLHIYREYVQLLLHDTAMLILSLSSLIRHIPTSRKRTSTCAGALGFSFSLCIFLLLQSSLLCYLWLKGERFFSFSADLGLFGYIQYFIDVWKLLQQEHYTFISVCSPYLYINTCTALSLCTDRPHFAVCILQYSYSDLP